MPRHFIAFLAVAGLLAACGSAGPTPTAPSASPPERPSPSGTPSSPSGTPPTPEPVWNWRTLHRSPLDGSIVPVYDGRYLVTSTGFVSGGTDLTVTELRTRRVVVRYDTPPGYAVQGVWLSGRWMLVEETEYQPSTYAIRLYRFNLETGGVDPLHQGRLPAAATEPEMSAAGNVLAYIGDDRTGRQCMHRVAVDTLRFEVGGCVPKGTVLGDPQVSADGTVTFSQVDNPNTAKRCKRLYQWPARTAAVIRVPAVRECIQWSGAMADGGVVWSEVHPTRENVLYSKAYARAANGQQIYLGLVMTDTIRPCRDWIYWNAPANHRVGGAEALYRWRPGRYVEPRFGPPSGDAKATAVNCGGDQLTIRVDTVQPAGSTTLAHSAL